MLPQRRCEIAFKCPPSNVSGVFAFRLHPIVGKSFFGFLASCGQEQPGLHRGNCTCAAGLHSREDLPIGAMKISAFALSAAAAVVVVGAVAVRYSGMKKKKREVEDTGASVDPSRTCKQGFHSKLVPADVDVIIIGSGMGES